MAFVLDVVGRRVVASIDNHKMYYNIFVFFSRDA